MNFEISKEILNNQTQFVILTKKDGTIIFVNKPLLDFFKLNENDVINKKLWEIKLWVKNDFHKENMQYLHSQINKTKSKSLIINQKAIINKKHVYFNINLKLLYLDKSQEFILLEIKEVTKTKNLENEIDNIRSLLFAALENNPAGIIIAEAPNGKIKFINSAAIGKTKIDFNSIKNLNIQDINEIAKSYYPDGTRYKLDDLPIVRAYKYGETFKNVEILLELPNEETKTILAYAAPFHNKKNEIQGSILIYPDISEKRIIEEVLHKKQKMDTIGNLAGGIAHDFNNMLGAIAGYTDLLSKIETDKMKIEFLTAIKKAIDRSSNLTKKLLTFSKQSDKKIQSVNLNFLVEEILDIFKYTISKNITIKKSFDEELFDIDGDISQINQIIMNIVLNAAESIHNKGEICITTKSIKNKTIQLNYLNKQINGNFVKLEIIDSGSGIPQEILPHIFEPFFTTKNDQGTGLGLATVWGILKNHNSYIDINTKKGEGTSFKIYFPEGIIKQKQEKEITNANNSNLKNYNILVVDDEKIIRDMLNTAFTQLQSKVYLASCGKEAIDIFVKNKIDIVLLDLKMLGLTSDQIVKELRKHNKDIKIIVNTGYASEEEINNVLNLKVEGFIKKPYEIDNLKNTILKAF